MVATTTERELKRTLIAGLLLALGSLASGCGDTSYVIVLRIPDDFSGIVRFIQSDDGQDPDAIGGVVIYDVPPSGVVRSRTHEYLESWHQIEAETVSGRRIGMGSHSSDDGKVAVFALATVLDHGDGDRLHRSYLIGTRDQYESVVEKGEW